MVSPFFVFMAYANVNIKMNQHSLMKENKKI